MSQCVHLYLFVYEYVGKDCGILLVQHQTTADLCRHLEFPCARYSRVVPNNKSYNLLLANYSSLGSSETLQTIFGRIVLAVLEFRFFRFFRWIFINLEIQHF